MYAIIMSARRLKHRPDFIRLVINYDTLQLAVRDNDLPGQGKWILIFPFHYQIWDNRKEPLSSGG